MDAEFTDAVVAKTCTECKTNRTPLWINGPNGPKVSQFFVFCEVSCFFLRKKFMQVWYAVCLLDLVNFHGFQALTRGFWSLQSLCNACGIRFKKIGKREQQKAGSRLPSVSSVRQMTAKRKQQDSDKYDPMPRDAAIAAASHPLRKKSTATVTAAPTGGRHRDRRRSSEESSLNERQLLNNVISISARREGKRAPIPWRLCADRLPRTKKRERCSSWLYHMDLSMLS